jgi:hypothetical protein
MRKNAFVVTITIFMSSFHHSSSSAIDDITFYRTGTVLSAEIIGQTPFDDYGTADVAAMEKSDYILVCLIPKLLDKLEALSRMMVPRSPGNLVSELLVKEAEVFL